MSEFEPTGENIKPIDLEMEMKESFLTYAMSVIASRALPDVKDGLKPVHRRILYAMNELNLDPSKGYKKSARIVGDTMGKYHPHGNLAIYDAMVRMAQPFSLRYPLVDGHGNFGSMDGDGAAAERYTEARLAPLAMEMLRDIDKNTVDFMSTYDEEGKEPVTLPARFPNLLVNGASGIAVGMATNIPPHNLAEAIDGVIKIIDNFVDNTQETDIEELIQIVKGPDFPTGASILGTNGIKSAYRTGRGKVVIRADADIEVLSNGRERITVTSLPYQVNKARLVEKIAELVKEKRVEGISDLKDVSGRHGLKIVIDLKKDANANVILNKLYKYTQLQENFNVNMLALINNQPRVFNLKQMLVHYLDHQKDVVTRRTQFDLDKALRRAHIVEGLLKALDIIDEIIALIRGSKDGAEARARLQEVFEFSELQAQAIVEMRLRSLTGLEKERLDTEYRELMETINYLQGILGDENRLLGVIKGELLVIKTKYDNGRRTEIVKDPGEIDFEDLINDEMSVITMTHLDYIKRLPLSTYKSQNRGGRGIKGMQTRDEDVVKDLFITNSHSSLLFFTNRGKVYRNKAYEIPESGRNSRGTNIVNLLNLDTGEKIAAVMPISAEENSGRFIIMVTKNGVIKKTPLKDFANIHKGGLRALTIKDEDELLIVLNSDGAQEVFLATKNGMSIRFKEEDIRSMGRIAAGVRAIRLKSTDQVIGAVLLMDGFDILFVSEKGFGKCTQKDAFKTQNRGGSGLRNYKITDKTGPLIGITPVNANEELMIINSSGVIIRIRIADISITGRVTQGVKLINLGEDETVVSIAKITEEQIEEEIEETEETSKSLEQEEIEGE
ncbi:MAG: DNA gyrase subunit A [Defluviitaleaceae bacterium]|nr:DNA gyrase subunit A [Defluviitaleaceae bacterium]